MKICLVTSSFPRKYPDHISPWLRDTSLELLKRGHELSAFVPAHMANRQTEYEGVEVKRFRYAPAAWERLTHEDSSPGNLGRLGWKLVLISYMICGSLSAVFFFSRRRFDVIDVHWPFPQAIFGIIGKYLSGARLVYHFYASEILLIQKSWFLRTLFDLMMFFADDLIAISNPTKVWVETMIKPKLPVNVVYFGNTIAFDSPPLVKKPDLARDPVKLFYAGKMIERLGPQHLIEAARILKERGVPFYIAMAGTGYMHEEIAAKIKAYGLTGNIDMMGFIYKEALIAEYRKCDIFIFPSILDSRGDTTGLGMVAIDALFYAKPVIASAVGGVVDVIIDGKTGYTVPPKDALALAEKIIYVRDHYEEASALALKGYAYALENFSWGPAISRLLKVYSGERV